MVGSHCYLVEDHRVEAIAFRVEAIATRAETIAIRVEPIATRVEAIAGGGYRYSDILRVKRCATSTFCFCRCRWSTVQLVSSKGYLCGDWLMYIVEHANHPVSWTCSLRNNVGPYSKCVQ